MSNNKTVLCISAFNQIWIAMIRIMMNNNFDSKSRLGIQNSTLEHIIKTKAKPCLLQKILAPETRKPNFLF